MITINIDDVNTKTELKKAIAEIKAFIINETKEQIEDKKILRKRHTENTRHTQASASFRSNYITALLIFYNVIRGKEISNNSNSNVRYHCRDLIRKYSKFVTEEDKNKIFQH